MTTLAILRALRAVSTLDVLPLFLFSRPDSVWGGLLQLLGLHVVVVVRGGVGASTSQVRRTSKHSLQPEWRVLPVTKSILPVASNQ